MSLLLISILISFLVSVIFIPLWIKKSKSSGLLWKDMNKYNHPKNVASSGGIVVVFSFIVGALSYIFIQTFVYNSGASIVSELFALISVILIMSLVGLTDDLLGWIKGGLSTNVRIFLAVVAAIPLIVINAGVSSVLLPFIGQVELGILFPLVIIPLAVAGFGTTFNFLAGFNGLEAGQGILIIGFLSYVAYVSHSPEIALVGLCMVASLIGFWFWNKNPARIFPGDILTYSVGAMIAGMAILGNFEKIALFVFIPYFIEIGLKLRGGLKKHSFGLPQKDGSLKMPYAKIYGLTHLSIWLLLKVKKRVYETDVVFLIHVFQILIILLAFFMI